MKLFGKRAPPSEPLHTVPSRVDMLTKECDTLRREHEQSGQVVDARCEEISEEITKTQLDLMNAVSLHTPYTLEELACHADASTGDLCTLITKTILSPDRTHEYLAWETVNVLEQYVPDRVYRNDDLVYVIKLLNWRFNTSNGEMRFERI